MGFDVGIIFCAIWENTNPIYSEIRPKYIEWFRATSTFPFRILTTHCLGSPAGIIR